MLCPLLPQDNTVDWTIHRNAAIQTAFLAQLQLPRGVKSPTGADSATTGAAAGELSSHWGLGGDVQQLGLARGVRGIASYMYTATKAAGHAIPKCEQ